MAHHYEDDYLDGSFGTDGQIGPEGVNLSDISDLVKKYGARSFLKVMPIKEIEKFLREKKLDNISNQ